MLALALRSVGSGWGRQAAATHLPKKRPRWQKHKAHKHFVTSAATRASVDAWALIEKGLKAIFGIGKKFSSSRASDNKEEDGSLGGEALALCGCGEGRGLQEV